jgi:hypothetical protein
MDARIISQSRLIFVLTTILKLCDNVNPEIGGGSMFSGIYTRPFLGKSQLCPKCMIVKDILTGFGLYKFFCGEPLRPVIAPKEVCTKCRHKVRSRAGRLARLHFPNRQRCGVVGCRRMGERHHPDYNEPLIILWRCRQHHHDIHYPSRLVGRKSGS